MRGVESRYYEDFPHLERNDTHAFRCPSPDALKATCSLCYTERTPPAEVVICP